MKVAQYAINSLMKVARSHEYSLMKVARSPEYSLIKVAEHQKTNFYAGQEAGRRKQKNDR